MKEIPRILDLSHILWGNKTIKFIVNVISIYLNIVDIYGYSAMKKCIVFCFDSVLILFDSIVPQ